MMSELRVQLAAAEWTQLHNVVRWDLLALSMRHEYGEVVGASPYYDELEAWYLAGHFPCGWLGVVPDYMENAFMFGKLAVF